MLKWLCSKVMLGTAFESDHLAQGHCSFEKTLAKGLQGSSTTMVLSAHPLQFLSMVHLRDTPFAKEICDSHSDVLRLAALSWVDIYDFEGSGSRPKTPPVRPTVEEAGPWTYIFFTTYSRYHIFIYHTNRPILLLITKENQTIPFHCWFSLVGNCYIRLWQFSGWPRYGFDHVWPYHVHGRSGASTSSCWVRASTWTRPRRSRSTVMLGGSASSSLTSFGTFAPTVAPENLVWLYHILLEFFIC